MARFLMFAFCALALSVTDASIIAKLKALRQQCLGKHSEPVADVAASEYGYTSLTSKYSMLGKPNVDSFFTIPRTVDQAKAADWQQPPETVDATTLSTYCENSDFRICTLFDAKGTIAGYQISIPTSVDTQDIRGIDYTTKGFIKQKLFGSEVYSTKIYFVEQEVITSGGRDFNNVTGTGLWLQAGNDLIEIPLKAEEVEPKTPFKKQNCFFRMGHHYFYNLTRDMQPDGYQPWFLLYNNDGILHGFGFIAFGSQADYYIGNTRRSWFEDVNAAAIAAIAPSAPDWILETITNAGIYAHHVYFQEEPWNYKCPAQAPKVDHY